MSDDFKACQKAAKVAVPKNGMAILIKPGNNTEEYTMFDVQLVHNFERGAKELTKDDKTLYLIAQGLLEISMHEGEYVLDTGFAVMNKYLKGLTADNQIDLDNMKPQGSC